MKTTASADQTAAMKKELAQRKQRREEIKRQYREACEKQFPLFLSVAIGTLVCSIIMIILMFQRSIYISNPDVSASSGVAEGIEIWVKGGSLLGALFQNGFKTTNFDNIDTFYYWVPGQVVSLSVFSLISLVASVLLALLSAVALLAVIKRNYHLAGLVMIAAALAFVAFTGAYFSVVGATDTMIVNYCSSNPKCHVRSDLLWGMIFSLIVLAGNIFTFISYCKTERVLHTENRTAKEETA